MLVQQVNTKIKMLNLDVNHVQQVNTKIKMLKLDVSRIVMLVLLLIAQKHHAMLVQQVNTKIKMLELDVNRTVMLVLLLIVQKHHAINAQMANIKIKMVNQDARFVTAENTKIKNIQICVKIVHPVDTLWIQPRMLKSTTNNKTVFIVSRVQNLSVAQQFVPIATVANTNIKSIAHWCQSPANFVLLVKNFKAQQQIVWIASKANTKIATMNRRQSADCVQRVR